MPEQRYLLPVLFAGSAPFDANCRKSIPSLAKLPACSVGSAAPEAVHLSEEVDSRQAFDTRIRHLGFEFLGNYEGARLFQTLPFEEKCEVVDVSSAAENTATELAVFAAPVKGGIERRFPGRIIGDFVVDENGNHDFGGTPFTVKTLLQTQEKCKGSDHRGLDLRAGCDPLDGRGRGKWSAPEIRYGRVIDILGPLVETRPGSECPVAVAYRPPVDYQIRYRWE